MPESFHDDIDATARHWFIRQQGRALSAEEQRALTDWLAASPDHRTAWTRAEEDWQSLDRFRTDLSGELNKARHYRPRHYSPRHLKWAAAALVLIALPILYRASAGIPQHWQTATGERQHVILADGSQLSLDTATRVTITQSWFQRLIQLQEGEIYLEVAPDWRPLQVTAADTRIRDIGTRFSVRDTPEKFTVQVEEGAVEIIRQDKHLVLHTGETVTRHPATDRWQLAAVQGEIANWRQGILVFDQHRLPEVLQELARYHAVRFDLADPALGRKQISGRFRLDELDTTLRIIAETLNLNIEHPAPDRYLLSAAQKQ